MIKTASVDNIIKYYSLATADTISAGRAWYPNMRAMLSDMSAGTSYTIEQCADVFAACSINTPWVRNIRTATQYIRDGELRGHLGFVLAYVRRVLAGERLTDMIKDATNLKIRSFSRNLAGDYSVITVDRHAYRIATDFADCAMRDNRVSGVPVPCAANGRHSCGTVPTGDTYRTIEAMYFAASVLVGEHGADLQAITWCVVRGTGD